MPRRPHTGLGSGLCFPIPQDLCSWTILREKNGKFDESRKVEKGFFLSFPRRRESTLSMVIWTPAFAGVTIWGLFKNPSTLLLL
jgi:hypothetical protein